MKKLHILIFSFFSLLIFSSCSDMLETDSEMVEFEKDNTYSQATDTVYTTMGIINSLQRIADRVILLGEVRGDLMTTTDAASDDLKRLADFDFSKENKYNAVSDYYAVINNCNYFIANVDTAMHRRGRSLFKPEYAAAKSFRAWTYLQLALAYGEVPLILTPSMTEQAAREAMEQPRVGIAEICKYFIDDLTPLVGIELPQFGDINDQDSRRFFIPMRALLGDLCLWAQRYGEAAKWYHEYLTDVEEPIHLNYGQRVQWYNTSEYNSIVDGYSPMGLQELLTYIPMETRIFDGVVSDLDNIYNSTNENKNYFQLTPSSAIISLSAAQRYSFEVANGNKKDTIYAPQQGLANKLTIGDLRLFSNYSANTTGAQSEYSEYSTSYQHIYKIREDRIALYRRTMVYLHYAEALNLAGYPQSAFLILKRGISQDNIDLYVDTLEQKAAGDLIYFNPLEFSETTYGIHAYGSGDAYANRYYTLPQPAAGEAATRQDTIAFQQKKVEQLIVDELALEGAFEGCRFYDLMRLAQRHHDNALLADPVANRKGTADAALRTKLMDEKNWYLPLP